MCKQVGLNCTRMACKDYNDSYLRDLFNFNECFFAFSEIFQILMKKFFMFMARDLSKHLGEGLVRRISFVLIIH